MTERTTTDFTEHVFRSVRGWLHRLFPDLNIYVTRKQAKDDPSRPAARIEMGSGPTITPAAQGFVWADYLVGISYAATDLYDAQRTVGKIVAAAQAPAGRIPLKLYNWEWPVQPHVTSVASTGAWGASPAIVDLALVGESMDGGLSAPSERLSVMVDVDTTLSIVLRGWQDIRKVRLYAALEGQPLKLQAVGIDGDVVAMDHLYAGASLEASPVLPYAGLRVTSVGATTEECKDQEENFDGMVSIGLRTLVPWSWVADVDPSLTPS